MAKVIIDPGHGGRDNGATFQGRMEKNDALELSMAIGEILTENGVQVMYTRVDDVYDTPYEKAVIANNSGADYFVSIHRNASTPPGMYEGAQVLVYDKNSVAGNLADNIQKEMVALGFDDEGVVERKDLAVLRRTTMPAVLVEAGFIDSEVDNQIFDANFEGLAQAIADGILQTIPSPVSSQLVVQNTDPSQTPMDDSQPDTPMIMGEPADPSDETMPKRRPMGQPMCPCPGGQKLYQVQVGSYRNYNYASQQLAQLLNEGYPAYIVYEDGLYKVRVGAYAYLENAVVMEGKLRNAGYNTYITT